MFKDAKAFSGFSVNGIQKARSFMAKHSDWRFLKLMAY